MDITKNYEPEKNRSPKQKDSRRIFMLVCETFRESILIEGDQLKMRFSCSFARISKSQNPEVAIRLLVLSGLRSPSPMGGNLP